MIEFSIVQLASEIQIPLQEQKYRITTPRVDMINPKIEHL